MTDDKGAGDGPYGHTPVSGNSTHTGEGWKACGYVEGYAAGRASRDGLRKALEYAIQQDASPEKFAPESNGWQAVAFNALGADSKALEADGEGR